MQNINWKSVLIGTAVAVFFSVFYALGMFGNMGYRVYDFLLRFRADRRRSDVVVFLNVDDNAIAYNGVFPWPRSIVADTLLRLKEFGAGAVIFDIEYIDRGPQGVDTIYLNQGLSADFNRSFSEINSAAAEIFSSLGSSLRIGRINQAGIDEFAQAFSGFVREERENLYTRAQAIARDNDQYLIQASQLFGKSWSTLNLRMEPLFGEQAQRRIIAEEHFSYPINAAANANKGKYLDILPALPGFSLAAQGAGFTNVEIDQDGIRRRIDLAQNIHDHWYLQLSFAPLMHYLGNPELELDNRRIIIKNAELPGATSRDISIPLDGNGRMVLDWPKENYFDSYFHLSFYEFSLLEDIEAELEQYSRAFGTTALDFFDQFDDSLKIIPYIIGELEELFEAIHAVRAAALEYSSEKFFADYVEYRSQCRALIRRLIDIDPAGKIEAILPDLIEAFPGAAEDIIDEAEYIAILAEFLTINLDRYEEITANLENAVKDKFLILGRVDTGTTDIGANPFHGEYVNVGTHGVVLDMILSEVFIIHVDLQWRILFTLVFVFLFFLASSKLSPVPRAISGFVMTFFAAAASAFLFRLTGIFVNPLLTIISMIIAVILREIISYAGSEREKQFIRKAFSTYVSGDVVKEIIADPSRLQLGGTERYMTAVFTDVKGFSSISEQLSPEELVSLLNRYLSVMSDIVLEEKGTIDKYIGDAIVAFYGAPLVLEDHALRACVSAIKMRKAEEELNKIIMEKKSSPMPLMTRFGINTGYMVAGNMGTDNKMNYTIMGNAVNLAARLEGANKQYGTWILASDNAVQQAGSHIFTRRLDRIRVVGIDEPVQIHELLGIMDQAEQEQVKIVEVFHQALDLLEKRNWQQAMQGFQEAFFLEKGGPSLIYLERCKTYLTYPPLESWDGVHNLTEK